MKRPKTIGEWLLACELLVADIVLYNREDSLEDEIPLWEGKAYDFPLIYANLKLDYDFAKKEGMTGPIDFRTDLGETHNHRPGFVVMVK